MPKSYPEDKSILEMTKRGRKRRLENEDGHLLFRTIVPQYASKLLYRKGCYHKLETAAAAIRK